MQYTVHLTAGVPQRLAYAGRFFLLEDTGAASSIALRFALLGESDEDIPEARRNFKLRVTTTRFTAVELAAAVNATVKVIVSDNDVDIDTFTGAAVVATIAANPLPVSTDRGTPGNLMHVTGVSLADAPATSATSAAPVACGPVAALVAAADANRRALRFRNLGPDPVAIGPAGATWAQRVIVLLPDDVWVEDRGANLAWHGITDAAKAASVTVQGVLA